MPIPEPILEGMRNAPHLYQMSIEQIRRVFTEQCAAAPKLPYAGTVEDRSIPTARRETPIRVYSMPCDPPAPVIMFFHGGGMVFGDLNILDAACRYLSEHTPCTVISVDYALSPESKFPGPLEECYDAVMWAVKNTESLGIDPARIAVAGDSAGGNLSAAMCMLARERKAFSIVHQVLLYPWLDLACDATEKVNEHNKIPLDGGDLNFCRDMYLTDVAAEGKLPLVSPVYAEDLTGLPPATLITEDLDPLQKEGQLYAQRLTKAGVPVGSMNFPNMIHAFIQFTGFAEEASVALDFVCGQLQKTFFA